MNPKVSVIIPTYNCAQFLPEALDSVLNQTFKDFEIIIIDDGSQDNTKEVLAPYLSKYPGIVYYTYQHNKGHAGARNVGILNSRSELIAFLDADDMWKPEKLQVQMSILHGNDNIGLVHTCSLRIDEHGIPLNVYSKNTRYLSGYIFKHLLLRKAFINCSSVLLRKKCIDKVGMFDEALTRIGSEDKDLWIRFSKYYKVHFIDSPLVLWRQRKQSASDNGDILLQGQRYTVEKLFTHHQISFYFRSKAYGRIYKELADGYLGQGELQKAIRAYFQSLCFFPFSLFCYINILKLTFFCLKKIKNA